ncbi:MAG TPA: hypothetical protein PKD47_06230, partial [Solirubrobacterales bacterium]|nr:hypothetical protein [Solirubrobacterales bacterium]
HARHAGPALVSPTAASGPVRVVILSAGLVLGGEEVISGFDLLPIAIYVMAGLTAITTLQRVWHVRTELKKLDAAATE